MATAKTKETKTKATKAEKETKTKTTKVAKAEKETKTKTTKVAKTEKETKTKTTKVAKTEKETKTKTTKVAKAEKETKSKVTKAKAAANLEKPVKKKLEIFKEKLTATNLVKVIAERSDVDVKTVKNVLETTQELIVASLRKGGVGVVKVFGWNFKSVLKPATKGGEKKPNPFKKGEFIITKAKPASMKLKALPLKAVKDAVAI